MTMMMTTRALPTTSAEVRVIEDRPEWALLKPFVLKPPFALSLSMGSAGLSKAGDRPLTDTPAFTLRQAQGER